MTDLTAFFPQGALFQYLLVLSLLGGLAMLADKVSAVIGFDRISERNLVLMALAGGFAGIILGGMMFSHKTSKPEFWVPMAVATVIWGAVLIVYFFPAIVTF
ncbi:MAG: DUF1294 domain-containing protein [Thaumarchaeota archaeon]|nr:DUF1294 domain-containing protein [Nitrososphaerota archaeon]